MSCIDINFQRSKLRGSDYDFFYLVRPHSHLVTTTQNFDVVSIIFYVVRTTEKTHCCSQVRTDSFDVIKNKGICNQ